MADIRKRGPYQWQVRIRRKGHPSQTKTFNTKAEAEAWGQVTESEMVRSVFLSRKEAENTTLSDALDRYLQEVSSKKKGAYQESRRIENLKSHKLAKRNLASIQGKDIAEYRDERLKSVSQASVRLELALLSHLFNTAIREWGMNGLLNPVAQIRLPQKAVSRDRRLLPGEEERILAACDEYGGDLPYVVRLALVTGMRRGELASLTWENIDLKKRTATLPETKNGEKRGVPLSTKAIRILKAFPRQDGNVFEFIDSHSITTAFIRSLSRARKTYEKECDVQGIKPEAAFLLDLTFHDLRHEATSQLFEKGFDTMEVSAITGHETLQMLKRYTHLRAEDLAERMKENEMNDDENLEELRLAASRSEDRVIEVLRSTSLGTWLECYDEIQSGRLSTNEFTNIIFQRMNALSRNTLDDSANKAAISLWYENLTRSGFPNRTQWEMAWRSLNDGGGHDHRT